MAVVRHCYDGRVGDVFAATAYCGGKVVMSGGLAAYFTISFMDDQLGEVRVSGGLAAYFTDFMQG